MGRSRNRMRRDTSAIANRRLPVSALYSPVPYTNSYLRTIEDRRSYHPEGTYRPARLFNESRHRLRAISASRSRSVARSRYRAPQGFGQLVHSVGFVRPQKVLICVRRKIRREVLHAKGVAGRRGLRRPKYNWYSQVSCRR